MGHVDLHLVALQLGEEPAPARRGVLGVHVHSVLDRGRVLGLVQQHGEPRLQAQPDQVLVE
eukprot:7886271-Alexandrium_andersonii.AAC.1